MTRPRIALTVSNAPTAANLASRENYIRALARAGAEVIVIQPGESVPADVDAICFSGGGDIAPERYGEVDARHMCENVVPARDETELAAARRFLDADVPILGICRGFQLLNVAFGGSLALHITGHQAKGDEVITHTLRVEPGTKLAQATAAGEMLVNSRHHQAVTDDRLAPSLRATAHHDGLVEAFESNEHRWVIGVQWHPERTAEVDAAAARIFESFVKEATRSPIRTP